MWIAKPDDNGHCLRYSWRRRARGQPIMLRGPVDKHVAKRVSGDKK